MTGALSGAQFYRGVSGAQKHNPGDVLVPGVDSRMRHLYYTSNLNTAKTYATWGGPDMYNPEPGHIYAVQPETTTGRKIGRHGRDPMSGVSGNEDAYRTKSRLRVLHEVDKETGEPL